MRHGGRESAAAARPDMWRPTSIGVRSGASKATESLRLPGVDDPGLRAGAGEAFQRFGSGRVTWRELIEPAVRWPPTGSEVSPYLYRLWMPWTDRMRDFLESGDGPASCRRRRNARASTSRRTAASTGSASAWSSTTTPARSSASPSRARTSSTRARRRPLVADFQRNGGLMSPRRSAIISRRRRRAARRHFSRYRGAHRAVPTVGPVTRRDPQRARRARPRTARVELAAYLGCLARAMHLGFRDRMGCSAIRTSSTSRSSGSCRRSTPPISAGSSRTASVGAGRCRRSRHRPRRRTRARSTSTGTPQRSRTRSASRPAS